MAGEPGGRGGKGEEGKEKKECRIKKDETKDFSFFFFFFFSPGRKSSAGNPARVRHSPPAAGSLRAPSIAPESGDSTSFIPAFGDPLRISPSAKLEGLQLLQHQTWGVPPECPSPERGGLCSPCPQSGEPHLLQAQTGHPLPIWRMPHTTKQRSLISLTSNMGDARLPQVPKPNPKSGNTPPPVPNSGTASAGP